MTDPKSEPQVIEAGAPNAIEPAPEAQLPMAVENQAVVMIQQAVAAGKDLDYVERLMQLEREWRADRAKEAFFEAMAGFRGEAVKIIKSNRAGFDHKSGGGRTEYSYEDLSDVVDAAVPALSKWGLSHDWDLDQGDAGKIKVTCTLTHKNGHSKSVPLSASPDNSGTKNPIQAIKSTITYLERITLLAVTGLSAKGMDDDGQSASKPDVEYIDEEKVVKIKGKLKSLGSDHDAFLRFCKCESFEVIPVEKYEYIILTLTQREKEQEGDAGEKPESGE